MKRLNCGCGSIQPEGWYNADIKDFGQDWKADVLSGAHLKRTKIGIYYDFAAHDPAEWGEFDYIVANHLLSDFGHHDLPAVFRNLRSWLKPGGVLRILVPDILCAAEALGGDVGNGDTGWFNREPYPGWFPQGNDMPDIDERFCTFVTWFGESKSVFTFGYLKVLGARHGFEVWHFQLSCGKTGFGPPEIAELDDRCGEALIVEFRRPEEA